MNTFRRILPLLLSALCLAAMFLFAAFSDRYLSVVTEGIALWAAVVLPSLFPFFFLTALLTGLNAVSGLAARMTPVTKRLFRTPGQTAYAFAMSAVSGYPVGAKILATLAGDKQLPRTTPPAPPASAPPCPPCSRSGASARGFCPIRPRA